MLWFLLGDLARRPTWITRFPKTFKWYYRGTVAVSLVLWMVLLLASSRRNSKLARLPEALFLALFVAASGTQGSFFSLFHWYLNLDAEWYSHSIARTLVGTLPLWRPIVWFHFAASLCAGLLFVRLARRWTRPSKWPWVASLVLVPAVICAIYFVPVSYAEKQASTPDILYFHAMIGSVKEQLGLTHEIGLQRPQQRHPFSVPTLAPKPALPRNVILLLQESQRADSTCIDYQPHCPLATPFSNRVVPDRIPFFEWRALDSSTVLSCSTIWTGLVPSDPLRDLERAPTIWAFAAAAGYDTAYFTSQNAVFQNFRMQMQDEPIDHFACSTTIDLGADWDLGARDMLLSNYFIDHLSELREPFFAVVHYANQHSPYLYDSRYAPFSYDRDLPPTSNRNRMAHHRNVVYLSDMAVAKLLDFVKASDVGKRTVIAFTSDHSESQAGAGDHAMWGHTFSLFDSEVLVPTWFDAPPGTLTDDERANLVAKRQAFVTHADFMPTFLDLIGVWDDPKIAPFRAHMPGHPITRAELTTDPLPMTSCSNIWECVGPNWGMIQGNRKLHGRGKMKRYGCFDLAVDPGEAHNLGEDGCPDLARLAHGLFYDLENPPKPYRPRR